MNTLLFLSFIQGSYGNYALSLIGFVYPNTSNLTSLLFFAQAFAMLLGFQNIHSICQKLQMFRYERMMSVTTVPHFIVATLVSEIPFTVPFAGLYATVLFFWVEMSNSAEDYFFFVGMMMMNCCVGIFLYVFLGAMLKKELFVRDFFFVVLTFIVVISGFPFPLKNMYQFLRTISNANPFTWCFLSLMAWKFNHYEDGGQYLKNYKGQHFDHYDSFYYLLYIMLVYLALAVFFLLPPSNYLTRIGGSAKQRDTELSHENSMASRDSAASTVRNTLDGTLLRKSSLLPLNDTRSSNMVSRPNMDS